jgi:DNA-binding NarL/FixJ family response regulator
VVLVEDEPVARTATRAILEADAFEVTGEAATADDGLELTLRERPDVCLVDVGIPGGGITVAREISARLRETAVVMLTASEDHDDLIDSIRAGATGYLLKSMDPSRLTAALRGVLAGEAAIPRSLTAHLVSQLHTQGRHRVVVGENGRAELSSREWEVLELMCEGLTNSQIAERLVLSPVTIRRHTAEVARKLGVVDRESAVGLVQGQLRP